MSRVTSTTTHAVGSVLAGGYHVIDVKQGGMGVVYICHQATTDQFYAVKTVLFGGGSEDQEREVRFRDEVLNWIRLSARHRHPNIVQALLYNQDEKWLFLEFVDGLGLHETIPGGPAHLHHALNWARGIAVGMRVLHEEFSLLHRDLKPQNVLVRGADLVPKITDLGIGKILQEGSKGSTLIGTPGYMAPEAFDGITDFRSDVFSFGALLYRLISGASPSKQAALLGRASDPPSSANPRVPPELDELVRLCLAPDPDQRLSSFREVQARLETLPEFLADEYGEGYRRCDVHGFYSPIDEKLPPCLFCAQSEQQLELFETAKQLRSTPHPGVAANDPNQVTLTSGRGGTVTAPEGREVRSFVESPSTVTQLAARPATGVAIGAEVDEQVPFYRRLWFLGIAGLVVAFVTWQGLAPFLGGGATPVSDGSAPIQDGARVACALAGCPDTFLQQTFQYNGAVHPQRFCGRHFECTVCSMRYGERAVSSQICTVCGNPAIKPVPANGSDK
ncbi:MAG: serine/threonine protein kinase [Planctomycetota bacterium]